MRPRATSDLTFTVQIRQFMPYISNKENQTCPFRVSNESTSFVEQYEILITLVSYRF